MFFVPHYECCKRTYILKCWWLTLLACNNSVLPFIACMRSNHKARELFISHQVCCWGPKEVCSINFGAIWTRFDVKTFWINSEHNNKIICAEQRVSNGHWTSFIKWTIMQGSALKEKQHKPVNEDAKDDIWIQIIPIFCVLYTHQVPGTAPWDICAVQQHSMSLTGKTFCQ